MFRMVRELLSIVMRRETPVRSRCLSSDQPHVSRGGNALDRLRSLESTQCGVILHRPISMRVREWDQARSQRTWSDHRPDINCFRVCRELILAPKCGLNVEATCLYAGSTICIGSGDT